MTEERPLYVTDASTAVKWHLKDEQHSVQALALLDDLEHFRVDLIAPDHISVEVPAAIRQAVKRQRITIDQGESAIRRFLGMNLSLIPSRTLSIASFHLSLRHELSYYDCLYVVLAANLKCPLIYADEKLPKNLSGNLAPLIWIGNYHTP